MKETTKADPENLFRNRKIVNLEIRVPVLAIRS